MNYRAGKTVTLVVFRYQWQDWGRIQTIAHEKAVPALDDFHTHSGLQVYL